MKEIKVIYKSTNELIPYARNSRTHSDEQVSQIMSSISEFGFTNPVLTDGENGIIAGHGRVLASQRLGLKEVPTIELSHLTEAQKKAYIIADNKLALNSGWDEDMLRIEIGELQEFGFDCSNLGFDFEFDETISEDDDFEVNLPSGDKTPIRQMAFTLSDEQQALVEEALKIAKSYKPFDPAGVNDNSNGNALYYICEVFKNGLGC